MKIFEYKNDHLIRTVKILGFPVYVDARTRIAREQLFLNGLVKTVRQVKGDRETDVEKNIELFGQPLMKIITDEYFIRKYVCGKLVQTVDRKERFKKRYLRHIDRQYDDIYVLNANSGEIYLFLTYAAESFIKRNNSKKPLFVATRRYHIDLIQMLMPEMPYLYVPAMFMDLFCNVSVTIGDRRLFTLFSSNHFRDVVKNLLNQPVGAAHYFTSILRRLDMQPRDLGYRQACPCKAAEDSMLQKVRTIGLNLDNFVFVAPHARSCDEYSKDFWLKLCNRLKKSGIDVFCNVAQRDKNPLKDFTYKTVGLTFSEAFALARRSRQIVCLRSGLAELLLQANVPEHVIYTQFQDSLTVDSVVSGFGLKILPNIRQENLIEYNTGEISEDEILENIMKSVCSQEVRVQHTA